MRAELKKSLSRCERALTVVEQRLGYTRNETLEIGFAEKQLQLDFKRDQGVVIPMPGLQLNSESQTGEEQSESLETQELEDWQKIKFQDGKQGKKVGNEEFLFFHFFEYFLNPVEPVRIEQRAFAWSSKH